MRIATGIQPSGPLHLGNYFGMIRPALALAREGEAFYFIADYHALTSTPDADTLRHRVHDLAIDLLACGLDPAHTIFFRQSDVPEVTELAWLLSGLTPVALLERAHAFKDKVQHGQAANHGLFSYPVLMAADVLIYRAELVPIGEDQRQHLEICREIASRFNRRYGHVFVLPDGRVGSGVAVVPGTDGQKMSKTYGNTIDLFAEEPALRRQIMSVITDSLPVEAPKDPERSTLLALLRLFVPPDKYAALAEHFRRGGLAYEALKSTLFEEIRIGLGPLRARRADLARDPDLVERALQAGAERARAEARQVLSEARRAVGLGRGPLDRGDLRAPLARARWW